MRILLTGATGFVGSRLLETLRAREHDVSVFVRDATTTAFPDDVTVFEGDVTDSERLEPALAGVDVAVYLIHSMGSSGDIAARDRKAARTFERAASATGVDRVVYLSGLGADRDGVSAHLRSRREVEILLGAGSYDLTVLRTAVIVGERSASFRMLFQPATRLPVMITPRWVDTPCQPIAIEDVIEYLVGVLETPETANETYEIGGPAALSFREMLLEIARICGGREPRILPVPVRSLQLSSYWVGLVTDVPTNVASPLIEGMKNPVVVTDDRLESLLEVQPMGFDAAVRRTVADRQASSVRQSSESNSARRSRGRDHGYGYDHDHDRAHPEQTAEKP
ncbi:NAD(P)H-binding protein [Natronosalvus vescus]|uniref:NAD(P)H-binding protein n=1 Tax=Natronosalvus vescus TaxID=2953881 RepID=UPI0020902054|nr:NAD(P)H-binding protein [Natronosalvus vescus]